MDKKELFIKTFIEAVRAPTDEEADEKSRLAFEIARNMTIGEVVRYQTEAMDKLLVEEQATETIH